MTIFQTAGLILTFAALGAYVNNRFLKLPATIGLMVVALVMSLTALGLNRLSWIDLSAASRFVSGIDFSDILLHGMLSFLLFAGALHVNFSELRKYRVIVTILATVGVVIATWVTGSLVWYGSQYLHVPLSYLHALIFGALIAPTDAVSVLGILKETGMSKSLRVKIGCESLLNDGVGVVVFMALLGMAEFPTTPSLELSRVATMLVWEGLGSVALGLSLGWITFRLLRPIDDYKVEVMLTLALAAGGYSLAEALHVSAPVTMVMAGLFIGNHGRTFGMSHRTRLHLDMFWELLDEILNAVLFMLIGLEMMVVSLSYTDIVMGIMGIMATLIGRFTSVALPVSLLGLRTRFEKGTVILLTWGGLRGGISIALALSLPPGPEKDLVLDMTYVGVVFSVLFQGTTFRHVAKAIVNKTALPIP